MNFAIGAACRPWRRLCASLILASTMVVASCSLIERERGYPGGNIGFAADKQLLARNHEQRVARYVIAMALLSPLMAETAETPLEAKLSAERIDAMFARLKLLRDAAAKCKQDINTGTFSAEFNCPTDDTPEATAYAFETLSLDVSISLFNATKQITDNLGIKTRITEVAQAASLDPLSLLNTLWNARKIIPVVLKYYATYRDVSLLVGSSVARTCGACEPLDAALAAVVNRGRPDGDQIAPVRTLFEETFKCIDTETCNTKWSLSKPEYLGLIFHIDRTCKTLFRIQQEDDQLEPKSCGTTDLAQEAGGNAESGQGATQFIADL